MKSFITLVILLLVLITACNHNRKDLEHEDQAGQPGSPEGEHAHDAEPKFYYTVYGNKFEVFAEADPLVAGEQSNLLVHITRLQDFKPLDTAMVTATLIIDDYYHTEMSGVLIRKGIYRFLIHPEAAGEGSLVLTIKTGTGDDTIMVPKVNAFAEHNSAHEAAEMNHVEEVNSVPFSKEQSWKIDFATEFPEVRPLGEVIKTTAQVEPANSNEFMMVARAGGIVSIVSDDLLEGQEVVSGEILFNITGGSMAENDVSVRFTEAVNNYERALADYERIRELAKENIVTQRELLEARQEYENAKALYDNLQNNFNEKGQQVTSPLNGFIRRIHVRNGEYVEAGTPLVSITRNQRLVLTAHLPLKYSRIIGKVTSANIRDVVGNNFFSLAQLNGVIISGGNAAAADNHLIPISMLIDNNGEFMPGTFAEVYLKTTSEKNKLTVPLASLLEEQGVYFIWVQLTPELFEKRMIIPGVNDGVNVEIAEGLSPDERIVSRGGIMIKLAESTGTIDAHAGHVH